MVIKFFTARANKCLILQVFLFLFWSQNTMANSLHPILSTHIGIVNSSVTENSTTLSDSSGNDVDSGGEASAVSLISANINYEFIVKPKKSYFFSLTAPLLSSDGSGFFLGKFGMNFYFSSLSSLFTYEDEGVSLTMSPSTRFYLGPSVGAGYIVYNLETARKSDVFFDLGLQTGLAKTFGQKWSLKAEVALGKGTGVATSTFNLQAFAGFSYFLGRE